MPTPKGLLIVAAFACALQSGCSPNRGPKTNAYLRAYHSAGVDFTAQLRQFSPIAAPRLPVLPQQPTPEQRREFNEARRNYPGALISYYGAAVERFGALSRLFVQAEGRLGKINAGGVEPDAVRLATLREHALGLSGVCCLEIGRLADLSRTALKRRQSNDELDEILTTVFASAMSGFGGGTLDGAVVAGLGGLVKGMGAVAEKRQAERAAISDQIARVGSTATEMKREVLEYQTAYAQLSTALSAKYPELDWGFMVPSQPAHQ